MTPVNVPRFILACQAGYEPSYLPDISFIATYQKGHHEFGSVRRSPEAHGELSKGDW